MRGSLPLGARRQEQEVSGAVGILRFSGVKTRLPEHGRLLVAEDAAHGSAREDSSRGDGREFAGGGHDPRQHRGGDAECRAHLLGPLEGFEVHEHGSRGVGDVADVVGIAGAGRPAASARGAGKPKYEPRIDGAERELPGLGPLAGARDVVENPPHLGAGEIRRDRQPGDLTDPILAARDRLGEAIADLAGAHILPDDRVVDGLAGGTVPDHRRLALIGDPDRRDLRRGEVRAHERLGHRRTYVAPDLQWVVLDPAGVGEDLRVFELRGGAANRHAVPVEDDRARRRRALIECENV